MKIFQKYFWVILLFVTAVCYLAISGFVGTRQIHNKISGYDFNQPVATLVLPEILHEVSGLTDIDEQTVAAVQDEKGIIFIYDLSNNKIINQIDFAGDGDYEGITRVAETLYVLRSDGQLFEVENYLSKDIRITTHDTGISAKDNEGLSYDPTGHRLLIASKSKAAKDKNDKNIREVFSFDLKTKTTSEIPVFEFNRKDVNQFLKDKHIRYITYSKSGKSSTSPKFKPSAIGIHPVTDQVYVLCSYDRLLLVFDKSGTIASVQLLDGQVFNKAEGITFFDNGDMLIANEGGDGVPTILRFNYQRER